MQLSTMTFAGRCLIILLSIMAVSPAVAGPVNVHGAWIREGPPTAEVLAGYMVLQNHDNTPRRLLAATSPVFSSIEIHRTIIESGRARMRHYPEVVLPAHSRLEFAPGGYHLMLFKPRRPLRQGDEVEITLCFENGDEVPVTAIVRRSTGSARQ